MLTNQSLLHCTKSISISCIAFIHLSLSWWWPFTWFSDLCLYCLMWRTIKYRVFGALWDAHGSFKPNQERERDGERAWRLWAEEADVSLHCWQTHYRWPIENTKHICVLSDKAVVGTTVPGTVLGNQPCWARDHVCIISNNTGPFQWTSWLKSL